MKGYDVRPSVRLAVCVSVPAWANSSKPAAAGFLHGPVAQQQL